MKLQINSLYWNNYNMDMVDAHKRVMDHFNIKVNYNQIDINHGVWMDHVMNNTKADIVGFIEPDCIPLNGDIVNEAVRYVKDNGSFVGIAQVSNHIDPKTHIYAAPAFFFVSKECWQRVNTSFVETRRSDVGEEFSYKAEELKIKYRTYYPNKFEREPVEGIWPLGSYGYYGVGTVFNDSIYHLYQGRLGNNAELYIQRCQEVIDGTFSSSNFHSATTFSYKGKIVS